jgi:hypothetical protein
MIRRRIAVRGSTILALLYGSPLLAQVDSTGLARAVATVMVEQTLDAGSRFDLEAGAAATRFDSLVAGQLRTQPKILRPTRSGTPRIRLGTRGIVADTSQLPRELRRFTVVMVYVSACEPSKDWGGRGHFWVNQAYYAFKRTGWGWTPITRFSYDNADGSCDPELEQG